MKPRETKHTGKTREGIPLQLVEHDGRTYLESDGHQLAANHLFISEQEIARLATAPFRPAKKPKCLFLGLGLGHMVKAACATLPQEAATFFVTLESNDLPAWADLSEESRDPRIVTLDLPPFENIPQEHAPYQAIFADLDYLEALAPEKWLPNRVRWLRQLSDSIKAGGLLAFIRYRRDTTLEKNLRLIGCDPIYEFAKVSEKSKKNRVLYLARKGHYQSPHQTT